jgi:hypothetical protein
VINLPRISTRMLWTGVRRMEKVAQWGASYFVLITRYYWVDQIKKNEVGGACGTHGKAEKRV